MAVTVTLGETAVAIRAATSAEAVPPPVAAVLQYLLAAAAELVIHYAAAAPDDIHNAAAIRLTGWLFDSDPSDREVGQALQNSGAASLLGPWRVHRAGIIEGVAPEPGPAPVPSDIPAPPDSGHFILSSENGALVWLAFPSPS